QDRRPSWLSALLRIPPDGKGTGPVHGPAGLSRDDGILRHDVSTRSGRGQDCGLICRIQRLCDAESSRPVPRHQQRRSRPESGVGMNIEISSHASKLTPEGETTKPFRPEPDRETELKIQLGGDAEERLRQELANSPLCEGPVETRNLVSVYHD